MLVSDVQQSESVIHIHISTLFPLASPSLPSSLSHPTRWSQSTELICLFKMVDSFSFFQFLLKCCFSEKPLFELVLLAFNLLFSNIVSCLCVYSPYQNLNAYLPSWVISIASSPLDFIKTWPMPTLFIVPLRPCCWEYS